MILPKTEIVVRDGGGEVITSLSVEPGEYVIGHEESCAIVAAVEGVSPRHVLLTVNFQEMLIEDLGSAKGTFIAGQPVTEAVRLWPGQGVQMGSATLTTRLLRGADGGESLLPWTEELRKQLPDELRREGRYAINRLVAQGGMGAILDARDQTIRRTVAMKVMLDPRFQDDLVRFIEEAQVTGQLEHPNIVPIYELGVDAHEQVFYTMKFVRGITLKKVLELLADGTPATVQKYPLAVLLTIFQKVCDAVAFAHSRGVIHRDLKPDNVMIGDFGEVLVMDWGLAKTMRSIDSLSAGLVRVPQGEQATHPVIRSARTDPGEQGATMAGTILGTPNFMAPEQAEGRIDAIDARSDIFALGGILYSILTLQLPFTGDTVEEILEKVVSGKIVPPGRVGLPPAGFRVSRNRTSKDGGDEGLGGSSSGQDARIGGRDAYPARKHLPGGRVPDSLSAVAMKALATKPADRYQTVPEFQKDIEAYQGGFATSAERAGALKQLALLAKRNRAASIGLAAVLLVGATFGTKALVEGQRAERSLAELRGTAPTFEAQSRSLLAEGRLDDALAKIGYAVKLAPDHADYHLARAHLLQSTQRFAEARDAYRQVLAQRAGDVAARVNLSLTEKLLAEKGSAPELPVTLQSTLLDALIAQGRDLEAAPLSTRLNRDSRTAEATIRARLANYTTQPGWQSNRIQRSGRGFLVNLAGLQLGDLHALRGLPIVELSLFRTSTTDLRPLTGLQLQALSIGDTRVSDLAPLRGMPLRTLNLSGTDVIDLTPLEGMPLQELLISNAKRLIDLRPLADLPIESLGVDMMPQIDFGVLRGLPLRTLLSRHDEKETRNFSIFSHSPTLEKISLPGEISDIGFLTTLPKLQQVEYHRGKGADIWIPVRDFLAMYSPMVPEIAAARAALAAAGITDLAIWRVARDPDGLLRLDLSGSPIADLSALRGLPIKKLDLYRTSVRDLMPLRAMPIRDLNLYATRVDDLSPLRGMPLTAIYLKDSQVRDVGILAEFSELEIIELPQDATNVERLRKLSKLRYLSARWDDATLRPAQTAEEFWKDFDAQDARVRK